MDREQEELQAKTQLYLLFDEIIDKSIQRYGKRVNLKFEAQSTQMNHIIKNLERSNSNLEKLTEHVKIQNGNVADVKKDVIDLRHLRELDVQGDEAKAEAKALTCPYKDDIKDMKDFMLKDSQATITRGTMYRYLKNTLWIILTIVSVVGGVYLILEKIIPWLQ